jgi:hypothetical protein
VTTVNALSVDQWIEEFQRLKKVNQQLMHVAVAKRRGR